MEDYYFRRSHVPAFGSWDWNDNLPFTQCFESTRQPHGFLPYSSYPADRDLYVAGDLYENDILTPAMIVVPRCRTKLGHHGNRNNKKQSKWEQVIVSDVKESPSPPAPKPVDEDLYKISPDLLYAKPKMKRGFRFLSSCFCAM